MSRQHFSFDGVCGRRLLPAALSVLLIAAVAVPAGAQRVITEPPRTGAPPGLPPIGGGGTGGGPGLLGPMPDLNSTLPSITPAPIPTPPAAVAPAAVPAAPARVVRFRCEVAPKDQSCREAGSGDGGGDDTECNCTRDYCYTTNTGTRVCEKLQ